MVERHADRTTSVDVDDERKRRRVSKSDTRGGASKSRDKYDEARSLRQRKTSTENCCSILSQRSCWRNGHIIQGRRLLHPRKKASRARLRSAQTACSLLSCKSDECRVTIVESLQNQRHDQGQHHQYLETQRRILSI